MLLPLLSWLCSSLVAAVCGGALPEAEVKIEVLHKPFLCHRKSKYGDMMLVHHQGYFENGTVFHDRLVVVVVQGVSSSVLGFCRLWYQMSDTFFSFFLCASTVVVIVLRVTNRQCGSYWASGR